MKKGFAMFFAVLFALAAGIPAFACGDGPAFSGYVAVCPDRVNRYRMDYDAEKMVKTGSYPAGTELKVWYETEIDGTGSAMNR